MLLSFKYNRVSKKICTLTLFTLLTGSTILAQNNNQVNFGQKGTKEIVGSAGTGLSFYDFAITSGTGLNVNYNSYVKDNFHIGTSLSFSMFNSTGQEAEGRVGTSFSIGYLFPITKNLYFDLKPAFSIGYRKYFFGEGMDFHPYVVTSIKQRFKSILINYGITHSFISYFSNPPYGNQWSDPYYNLSFNIGISVPL